ncbi:MAG: DUF1592 domain-containing protein [Verrucomicrobiae bacterium]|nr:DUF1592 domain-containing protein [Verrucomicrobiae bacterium]
MTRSIQAKLLCSVLLCVTLSAASQGVAETPAEKEFTSRQDEARRSFREGVTPFVKAYCAKCHGDKRRRAGLNYLAALKNPGETTSSKHWKQALANVKAHDMPPEDEDKQPSEEERQKFLDWIGTLKFLSPKDPGLFVIRRLNKAEYGNTLNELLGVDPNIAQDLPDEVLGAGYLNTLSPLQSEQYLAIANAALDKALPLDSDQPSEVEKRLFGDPPVAGSDLRAAAERVARSMGRLAYRRPVSPSEQDVLMKIYDLARASALSHRASLRLMLKAVLVSPQFLFITPSGDSKPDGNIIPLDDHQLASRLSYFLWSTMPDSELSALADQGKLRDSEVLRGQVERLLNDPRSRALFDGFGAQWLGLVDLKTKTFDTAKFPQMTQAMRSAMYDEARLFFGSIVRGNRSIVRFVDADYTYLNQTLATLYGLEMSVTGSEMRQVRMVNPNRGGILGMPGILATTSFPNRTSPVNRGVWVLENVLGEHVPPAPPNVPALEKQNPKTIENLTLRQRTELHVQNPVCANCHKFLDPIGFGLENFDAIGRWRDQDDTGGPIDSSGELPGGKRFSSPKELKAIIAARKDGLARNLTERLLAYALGRPITGYDEIVVDDLMKTIAADDYRMQTLVSAIVSSYPFMNRRVR